MVRCKDIKGSQWAACIGGFREVSIDDVDSFLNRIGAAVSPAAFQLFNAARIAGWEHIYFAAVNAVKAFESGSALSKSLGLEVLLYASCQDQIQRAFGILGVSPESDEVGLFIMARGMDEAREAFARVSGMIGLEDDSVLDVDDEKLGALKRVYSVTDLELEAVGGRDPEALTSLIIERCALLAVRR